MLKAHEFKPAIPPNILLRSETYYKTDNLKKVSRLPTQDELPCDDGVPMETGRHKSQMDLLIYPLRPWLAKHRGGYVGGNMFVYFSPKQVRNEDFKGPDVFVAHSVSSRRERKSWVVWEEGKSPDIVIELLSESTAKTDKSKKKLIYQNKLKVPEYYWFDPFNAKDWTGFRLEQGIYQKMPIDSQNRIISQELGLALILWHGFFDEIEATWLRWATLEGKVLPTPQEMAEIEKQQADVEKQRAEVEKQRAEVEKQRAEVEKQRAEAAIAEAKAAATEIVRLKALLAEKG